MIMRRCTCCKNEFPCTPQYFSFDKYFKPLSICHVCNRAKKNAYMHRNDGLQRKDRGYFLEYVKANNNKLYKSLINKYAYRPKRSES